MSRRFVAATALEVEEQLQRQIGDLKLAALMIDGIHFGEHVTAAMSEAAKGFRRLKELNEAQVLKAARSSTWM